MTHRRFSLGVLCAVAYVAASVGCIIEGEVLPDIVPDMGVTALAARCGDGVRAGAEACDDGNTAIGDGCDASCEVELCWVCHDDRLGGGSACHPQCDASAGESCLLGTCVSCHDGIQNGSETDVDCGGSCGPCDAGLGCDAEADCASGFCAGGVCCNEACDDGCVRCDLEGARGICAYVPESDPDEAWGCSGALACDGKGACKKVEGEPCDLGKECLSGKCVGFVCGGS